MKKEYRKYFTILNCLLVVFIILVILYKPLNTFMAPLFLEKPPQGLSYIALGDSYVEGTKIDAKDSWPSQLVQSLNNQSINITLVANLGKNGWTTRDVIKYQLPVVEKSQVSLVSLQIGVNDWVQGRSKEEFRSDFNDLLNKLGGLGYNSQNLFIVTIPDFSVSPNGYKYSGKRDISSGLYSFNQIIIEEGESRNITVVDIFEISQSFTSEHIANDNLHPSKKGYTLWVEKIEESKFLKRFK